MSHLGAATVLTLALERDLEQRCREMDAFREGIQNKLRFVARSAQDEDDRRFAIHELYWTIYPDMVPVEDIASAFGVGVRSIPTIAGQLDQERVCESCHHVLTVWHRTRSEYANRQNMRVMCPACHEYHQAGSGVLVGTEDTHDGQ